MRPMSAPGRSGHATLKKGLWVLTPERHRRANSAVTQQAEEAYRLFDTQTTGKAVILPP